MANDLILVEPYSEGHSLFGRSPNTSNMSKSKLITTHTHIASWSCWRCYSVENWYIKGNNYLFCFSCVNYSLFSHQVLSESLWHHGLQHIRLLYPSPSSGACTNSCPLSPWWHPTTSSPVIPFWCLQSCPASGSFPMSQLFISAGQSIGLQLQHQSFQWIFRVDLL